MKVVLDTNVVVSALLFGGVSGRLVELWQRDLISPLVSRPILDEYLAVLAYKKFRLSEDEVRFLVERMILPHFHVVRPKKALRLVAADASNDKFFECAVAGGAKFIVSGDRHVLNVKKFRGIEVVGVADFYARL